jgi:hypothetical protein
LKCNSSDRRMQYKIVRDSATKFTDSLTDGKLVGVQHEYEMH